MLHHTGPSGEAPGHSRGWGDGGGPLIRDFPVVSMARKGEAGQASLGLSISNNSGGLWGIGVVSSCLAPGSGLLQTRE